MVSLASSSFAVCSCSLILVASFDFLFRQKWKLIRCSRKGTTEMEADKKLQDDDDDSDEEESDEDEEVSGEVEESGDDEESGEDEELDEEIPASSAKKAAAVKAAPQKSKKDAAAPPQKKQKTTFDSSEDRDTPSPPNDPTEIQVFRPTMEEFKNFRAYVNYMESRGAHLAGVAKVIPPPGWRPRSSNYDNLDNIVIKRPLVQRVEGQHGVFTQYKSYQRDQMTVKYFEELANTRKFRPPSAFDIDIIERTYWQRVAVSQPIYGADIPGTLYDDDVNIWNINRLGSILDLLDIVNKRKIQGVNTAYLYFGTWASTFCWHTEDMDLYSINYLHFGAPKLWYSIPPAYNIRFEDLVASYFPEYTANCSAFLRHKMTLISPKILRANSIPVHKIAQNAITAPRRQILRLSVGSISENEPVLCDCGANAVRLSMDAFVEKYQSPEEYNEWLSKSSGGGREVHSRQSATAKMGGCTTTISKRRLGGSTG